MGGGISKQEKKYQDNKENKFALVQCLQDSKRLHQTNHWWNMPQEFIALQWPINLKQV